VPNLAFLEPIRGGCG